MILVAPAATSARNGELVQTLGIRINASVMLVSLGPIAQTSASTTHAKITPPVKSTSPIGEVTNAVVKVTRRAITAKWH